MQPTRVLITGSEGFIGSHLVEKLVREGFTVRALVLYNSFGSIGWLESLPLEIKNEVEIVQGDLRDSERMHEIVANCDAVIHLGSLIAIPYSFQAPRSYLDTNIMGTLNVLNACLAHGVQSLIHTSTSEVYGSAQYIPMDENHPVSPQSPYAASKASADHLVASFVASFELNATIIRPFNTYGPRQSLRAIIPTIIAQVVSGQNEIKLGNTDAIRDFTFVSDTVEGFLLALRNEATSGLTINLGTGSEWTIHEMVDFILEITGSKAEIQKSEERVRPRAAEVNRLISDTSRAKEILGWNPKYMGKEGVMRGLRETITWFENTIADHKFNASKYHV